jgi:hypothetical protein
VEGKEVIFAESVFVHENGSDAKSHEQPSEDLESGVFLKRVPACCEEGEVSLACNLDRGQGEQEKRDTDAGRVEGE